VEDRTTTELVALARDADEVAWKALVHRYRNVIWAASASFRFDRDTRDDVFQMTCLRLIDHLDSIREPERLAGWLSVTARRECLAIIRERARWNPQDDFESNAADGPPVDSAVIRDETVRIVAAALAEIEERCQELLRLVVAEPPLGYETIAEILGVPVGSIGPTRARCLEKLARRPGIVGISWEGTSSDKAVGTS